MPNNDKDTPKDDHGIRADEIIEMCNFAIKKSYESIFNKDKDSVTLEEIDKAINTAGNAWQLAMTLVNDSETLNDIRDDHDDDDDEDDDDDDEDDDDYNSDDDED